MISPLVGAGLSMAAPAAGREALKLVDQATQTFANMFSAAADAIGAKPASGAADSAEPVGKPVSIESIRTLGKHLAGEFHRRAIGALESAGIDTSHEISLRLGSQSEIVVMGGHPDKQLIEQLLNSGELPPLFSHLAGLQEITHAYDERQSFRESFSRDPLAAVASYSRTTHDAIAGVIQLTLSGEGITVDFPSW
jgi:hypothetical protein